MMASDGARVTSVNIWSNIIYILLGMKIRGRGGKGQ